MTFILAVIELLLLASLTLNRIQVIDCLRFKGVPYWTLALVVIAGLAEGLDAILTQWQVRVQDVGRVL